MLSPPSTALSRALALALLLALGAALPVRRTLSFNMFVLQPQDGAPERTVLATDGLSRFGPVIEYLVQRVQGLMSVRRPPDSTDNELDRAQESRVPGLVVRPSATKPGTFDVEVDVLVDDGRPPTPAPA